MNYTHAIEILKEMKGAKETDGEIGFVPAPTVEDKDTFLRSDGIWAIPPGKDNDATQEEHGLMSVEDKIKLDGIEEGATNYTHPVFQEANEGMYKITVNTEGHITKITKITKSDITGLGIPASDTTYSKFIGASSTSNGSAGLVPAPSSGNQDKFLRADGTWQTPIDTNTTYEDFLGCTTTVDGTSGLVPQPLKTDDNKFLNSNGTWQEIIQKEYFPVTSSENGLMTPEMLDKLNNIAPNANNYVHPTTAGNKHIPSGGSDGKVLIYGGSSGTAKWGTISFENATQETDGLMSADDKKTLDELNKSIRLTMGQVVQTIFPIKQAGMQLLDGSVIADGGIYSDFVTYIKSLQNSVPSMFTTESDYNLMISKYNACGKFVVLDNGNIKIPTINGFTEVTNIIDEVGNITEAGLPNITGGISCSQQEAIFDYASTKDMFNQESAFYNYNYSYVGGEVGFDHPSRLVQQTDTTVEYTHSTNDVVFDASRCSSVYGNSSTVQPQSVKVLYYICVANTIKTEYNLNVDEIINNFNNYLPLSGGTMTGGITFDGEGANDISNTTTTTTLTIRGGTNNTDGACIHLHGENITGESAAEQGGFCISASKDGVINSLVGKASGDLKWSGTLRVCNRIAGSGDRTNSIVGDDTTKELSIIADGSIYNNFTEAGYKEANGGASLYLHGINANRNLPATGEETTNDDVKGVFVLAARNGVTRRDLAGYPVIPGWDKGILSWEGTLRVASKKLGSLDQTPSICGVENDRELALCATNAKYTSKTGDKHLAGACLYLHGHTASKGYHTDGTVKTDEKPGGFYIVANKGNETDNYGFRGNADGTLSWSGQPMTTSSDERLKQDVKDVTDAVLDAWGDVNWCSFRYIADVNRKGDDKARKHNGLIAQHISRVFEEHKLDACEWGLLCLSTDANGDDMWSIRYEEALSMEASYQRRENKKLEKRIKDLEEKLAILIGD